MNQEQAIHYLSKDPLLHMDMLESIRSGSAELFFAGPEGVLLMNNACRTVMMSTEDERTAAGMLASVHEAPLFVAHQDFYIEDARRKFGLPQEMVCHQAVYLRKEPLPVTDAGLDIRQLDEGHLLLIMKHYSHAEDEEYPRERLKSGVMFGAFIRDQLAGFIGLHSEGSIGLLEVLPEYQRRGIAQGLETFLVNRLLAVGRVPFAQVIVGNTASLKLHRKLGFLISDKTVCWLM